MMIRPKIIHYCWFGPNKLPDLEMSCIESWKKNIPGWKLKLWNESNFDLNSSKFAHQAYVARQFAFVSDYVRAFVLYNYGGLYLDTDVKVLAGFDSVLNSTENFLGFETGRHVGTAVMAFTPYHPFIKELLLQYEQDFLLRNGDMLITANVAYLTNILLRHGLILNKKFQIVYDVSVFEREFFFPKKVSENCFKTTPKTVAVHLFSANWLTPRQRKRGNSSLWINFVRPSLLFLKYVLQRLLGRTFVNNFENKIRNFLR